MASVTKTSGPKPWQVRWRGPDGRQKKLSFARRVDADRHRAKVETTVAEGSYVDLAAARTPFRDRGEAWRRAQPVGANTRARHERELRNHAYPILGNRPIGQITTSELQAFATGLTQKMAPSSAKVIWSTVRAVFAAAARDRIIGHDPCKGVRLVPVPETEVWPLTLTQVETLAGVIEPRYRGLVVAGSGIGARQGELFGLEIASVDFMRRREVTIAQQVQMVDSKPVICPPKNGRRRVVPAAESVLAELGEHLRRFRHDTSPLMFPTPAGTALERNRFNDGIWWPAREAAAAEFRRMARAEPDRDAAAELERRAVQLEQCGTHDLRHFYASALIRFGLSVRAVAARLGHKDPTITLRTYAHLWPDDDDRSREAIDTVFGHSAGAVTLGDVPQLRPVEGSGG